MEEICLDFHFRSSNQSEAEQNQILCEELAMLNDT